MATMRQSQILTDGPAIRDMRDRAGYTLRSFAAELGVDHGHLGRVERGERQPGIALRNRIATTLGVSVDDIATPPVADMTPAT